MLGIPLKFWIVVFTVAVSAVCAVPSIPRAGRHTEAIDCFRVFVGAAGQGRWVEICPPVGHATS